MKLKQMNNEKSEHVNKFKKEIEEHIEQRPKRLERFGVEKGSCRYVDLDMRKEEESSKEKTK